MSGDEYARYLENVMSLRRRDIVWVGMSGRIGHEMNTTDKPDGRPVLVVQNNLGNAHSSKLIGVPLTGATEVKLRKKLPVHVLIRSKDLGAGGRHSLIDCSEVFTFDRRLRVNPDKGFPWARVSLQIMSMVDKALLVSLDLDRRVS
jgi:mRNA interferase MazF